MFGPESRTENDGSELGVNLSPLLYSLAKRELDDSAAHAARGEPETAAAGGSRVGNDLTLLVRKDVHADSAGGVRLQRAEQFPAPGDVLMTRSCCVVYFLPEELAALVQPIREKYDPTAHIIDPHVTLVFPADVAREVITRHIEGVLSRWDRFAVRFRGLSQSWDQWLFLDLDEESEAHMTRLHDDLYTGILTPHLSRSISYVPHVGLGHFGHPDERYDPLNPREGPLDGDRYKQAYAEATALQIDSEAVVEHLDLVGVADAATEVERITRFALSA